MILVAFGSNRAGAWGKPVATLQRAVGVLANCAGTTILGKSGLYETAGVGPGRPGVFVNGVIAMECHCGPEALLRRLKQIERMAGPRSALRWGPRTLDLDILDYSRRVCGWSIQGRSERPPYGQRIVLPHPRLHLRPFVLAPLAEIAPRWRHPVFNLTAQQLWGRMRTEWEGRVLRRLHGLNW